MSTAGSTNLLNLFVSLRARLTFLVLVPLLGLCAVVVAQTQHLRSGAGQIAAIELEANYTLDLAILARDLRSEQLTASGSLALRDRGIDPKLIRVIAGVNVDAESQISVDRVDVSVNVLSKNLRNSPDGPEIRAMLASLKDARRAVIEERDLAKVTACYTELGERVRVLLAKRVRRLRTQLGTSAGEVRVRRALDTTEAYLAAMDAFSMASDGLGRRVFPIGGATISAEELAWLDGRADATRSRLEHSLSGDLLATWTALYASPHALAAQNTRAKAFAIMENVKPGQTEIAPGVPAELIGAGVEAIAANAKVSEDFRDFTQSISKELRSATKSAAADARDEYQQALLLTAAVLSVTVLLTLLTLRSIARPLTQLRRHARRLVDGDLDGPEFGRHGPLEIAYVGHALDDIVANLRRLSSQADALATGRLDAPELTTPLPGRIGTALHESVSRWSYMQDRLRRSEAVASAIVDHAADAIWLLDAEGRIIEANAAAARLLAVAAEAQTGRVFADLCVSTRQGRDAIHASLVEGHALNGELTMVCASGPDVPVLVSSSPVLTDHDSLVAVFAHDIRERKAFERQLAHQARHDALTSLLNRSAAIEHLDLALARSQRTDGRVALLFFDLDGFKLVNDSYGHAVGDHLLALVADRLKGLVREGETLARLGGDEFVVIAEGIHDPAHAIAFGERMVDEVSKPYLIDGQVVKIGSSAGLALSAPVGAVQPSSLALLRDADVAVYQAKAQGRGRVVMFDVELQEWIDERSALERDLRKAIATSDLCVHYQPIVDVNTGSVWGAEALVRWDRSGIGMVSAAQFVPMAEASNLIVDLGRFVLATACAQLAAWHRQGRNLRIAVNVSGRHLTEGDVAADVRHALSVSGAPAELLEIELTESHLLIDLEAASKALAELREIGVTVALDDFGTGYSSLTYLRRFTLDKLKIDRSFVAGLGNSATDGHDASLIEMVVQLAGLLDVTVVAEGVELDEQLARVRSLGCEFAQGYLFTRPLPITALESWLDTQERTFDPVRQPETVSG